MSREVLQQALEALEDISAHEGITMQGNIAIATIKAALAQPAQEPVMWATPDGSGWRIRLAPPVVDVAMGWTALYISPPPSQPLTDEQIKEVINKIDPDKDYISSALRQLARAIEAAHGIGDKT